MKIGILGNMNNMYFSLARYLADEGYDCELLVFDYEPDHFHPSADTYKPKLNFTMRQLAWGDYGRFFKNSRRIESDLKPYDFLIGSGTAPAFVNRIGRKLDLFIPYGGDLYAFPFLRPVHPAKFISYWAFTRHQRAGIRQSPYLLFDKTNAEFEKVFAQLPYEGQRIVSPPPLFYHREYERELDRREGENPHTAALKKLRAENDLLILQHIRQFWKFHFDFWSRKGNNKLIEGYALFRQNNPQVKAKLLLLEYGLDVAASKRLIKSLGLGEHVVWFPKTLRKHLMQFVKICDVVVGELHYAWNTYCVVLETLATGKPLMHKRADAVLRNDYSELYPMLQASTPQSVCEGLQRVASDKAQMARMGADGRQWFLEYCVEKPLAHIRALIAAKANGRHA